MFVACENTATVVAVDMTGRHELGSTRVGDDPDVIAYDSGLHRLYVAAESGDVTILDAQQGHLVVTGSAASGRRRARGRPRLGHPPQLLPGPLGIRRPPCTARTRARTVITTVVGG